MRGARARAWAEAAAGTGERATADTTAEATSAATTAAGAPHDHVRIDVDRACCEALRRCADVLYGTGGPGRAAALLRRYPGCLLASVRDAGGRCVTVSRSGRRFTATGVRSEREHALLVSMLHRWITELSCPQGPSAGS